MNVLRFIYRGSSPEVFLGNSVLNICGKFTGKKPMLKCDFNLRCSPVDLLHIYFQKTTPYYKNTNQRLLLFTYRFYSYHVLDNSEEMISLDLTLLQR